MKNIFLLKELILEGRLEDVKKKYSDKIDVDIIERFSNQDPSGNNKYLEYMCQMYLHNPLSFGEADRIIDTVTKFHKNLNKIDNEFIQEVSQNSIVRKLIDDGVIEQKDIDLILKAPKDINSYKAIGMLNLINGFAGQKLTKSEIKKLESKILLNNSDLLILIPLSHKSSCFYGAGTKWCTTAKSDSYFKSYSRDGTLIYVINKKTDPNDTYHKVAFYIKKVSSAVSVFDVHDNEYTVQQIMNRIPEWKKVRDVIVNYLYSHDNKGALMGFYFGDELISLLNSLDINILETYSVSFLLRKLGFRVLKNYLNDRDINIYEYCRGEYAELIDAISQEGNVDGIPIANNYEAAVFLYNELIKIGECPLGIFYNELPHKYIFNIDVITRIGVDRLIDDVKRCDEGSYLTHGLRNMSFNSLYEIVSSISSNNIFNLQSIFEYIGADIFNLGSYNLNRILDRFYEDPNDKDKANFILSNIDKITNLRGFYTIDELRSIVGNEKVKELINSNKIIVSFQEYMGVFGLTKQAFFDYLNYTLDPNEELDNIINASSVITLVDIGSRIVTQIFKTPKEYLDFFNEITNNHNIVDEVLSDTAQCFRLFKETWFDDDGYLTYKHYVTNKWEKYLSLTDWLQIYIDAPIDDSDIRNYVKEMVIDHFSGNGTGKIHVDGEKTYVILDGYSYCDTFFTDPKLISDILDNDYITDSIGFSDIGVGVDDEAITNLFDVAVKPIREFIDYEEGYDVELPERFKYYDELQPILSEVDVKIDDDKLVFKLDVELVDKMSNKLLLYVIKNSLNTHILDALYSAYRESYITIISDTIVNRIIDSIKDVFGGGITKWEELTVRQRRGGDTKQKYFLLIEYTELMRDFLDYVQSVHDPDSEWLPDDVVGMIDKLMDDDAGRFNGKLDVDLDFPYVNTDKENFKSIFKEILSDRLYW